MTVLENVAFPLRRQGMSKAASRQDAAAMLSRLGLDAYIHRHPSELSGGQQQRVGLARALAARPRLFLFDEPTANLDAALKTSFSQEIRQQQQESQVAGLYVTHDVREAFAVADRVMILQQGHVEQLGSPLEIYECPLNEAIAGLCGLYTLLPGRIESFSNSEERGLVTIADKQFSVTLVATQHYPPDFEGSFMLRPEWGEIAHSDSPAEGLEAIVTQVNYQGAVTEYELATQVGKIPYRALGRPIVSIGEKVKWYPKRLGVLS
jgi:iron(III) transport system ATP-binding protein